MSDDDTYKGSGEELGRIDLGPLGELFFVDDGCRDSDTYIHMESTEGNEYRFSRSNPVSSVRREVGDAKLIEILTELDDALADSAAGGDSFEPRDPPAFICDGCGRTWARTQNETPDGPTDTCPECAGS